MEEVVARIAVSRLEESLEIYFLLYIKRFVEKNDELCAITELNVFLFGLCIGCRLIVIYLSFGLTCYLRS